MCVCVCVCVFACYRIFGDIIHLFVTTAITISFLWYSLYILISVILFVRKLCSEVMVLFTNCAVHRCSCSDLLLDSRMMQPSAGLEKANGG